MSTKVKIVLAVLALIALVIAGSLFKLDQRQKALVFQFGRIVNADVEPGLNFKIPFINNVRYFDARIQTMDQEEESYWGPPGSVRRIRVLETV